ncbi:helix-turn-helix transcriptional regulator [Ornithinicoccus hortensis]|uniref:Putative DNA-binding transcriptional regulator YafY n=1 Tax=Ornithinicoccus hortensis TaxID=82346 RepID=A0A542YPE0_9MICO|nr:YafY family protein [Ornithinicoccus hortensis]TQL49970.1 putative DNA-binding transcriptional regulator YafY [Ornithinicoccus hortensis]
MTDTTARVLQLLGLLQSRTLWTAQELAGRLGVTTRSVRRDVERLRGLGYPVRASRGAGGGYQLGPGRALPPLLLDPEEAVAVAVCLRLAAGGTVAGVDEAAVRALAKLDQVLPPRLRAHVTAVQESTVAIEGFSAGVDPDTLLTLARACRDLEMVRFDYTDRAGQPSERRVEPYRLVALGRRWYLLAFDPDRADWRSFRLDRMARAQGRGWRFTPREAPDAAEYVQRSVQQAPYREVATVLVGMPAAELAERVPPTAGRVRAVDDTTSELVTGAMDLRWAAAHLAMLDAPVTVLDPPELRQVMADLGQALLRASASTSPRASTT